MNWSKNASQLKNVNATNNRTNERKKSTNTNTQQKFVVPFTWKLILLNHSDCKLVQCINFYHFISTIYIESLDLCIKKHCVLAQNIWKPRRRVCKCQTHRQNSGCFVSLSFYLHSLFLALFRLRFLFSFALTFASRFSRSLNTMWCFNLVFIEFTHNNKRRGKKSNDFGWIGMVFFVLVVVAQRVESPQ